MIRLPDTEYVAGATRTSESATVTVYLKSPISNVEPAGAARISNSPFSPFSNVKNKENAVSSVAIVKAVMTALRLLPPPPPLFQGCFVLNCVGFHNFLSTFVSSGPSNHFFRLICSHAFIFYLQNSPKQAKRVNAGRCA